MKISEAVKLLERMGRGSVEITMTAGEPLVTRVSVSDYQLPFVHTGSTESERDDRKTAIRNTIAELKRLVGKLKKSSSDAGAESKYLSLSGYDADKTHVSLSVYGICSKVGTKKVTKKVVKILTPAVPAVTEEVEEEVEVAIWDCSIQDRLEVEAGAKAEVQA
jgi:hypothetical protein